MRRLLALVVAAGAFTAAPAQAATHQVRVEDNAFVPKTLQIEPGDTVAWTAVGSPHTVTADDRRFDFHPGRTLSAGEQVSWTFPDEEVVRYYCKLHGGPEGQGMAGVIRVGNPPAPPVPEVPVLVVPDDVPTLSAAAGGAQPGTQVLVRPGVYPEEVVVTVPGLNIRGLGEHPDDVVLDGDQRRGIGVTVAAPDVRIENLSVTAFLRSGVLIDGVSGTVIADAVLDSNGLHGIHARDPAGVTVRGTRVTGHGVAGIGIRDCVSCGARIDRAWIENNAAGVVAVDATGVAVRGSQVRGNAVGVVFRNVNGSAVTGNTLRDNAATNLWVASVLDGAEPPSGAGLWISGGRANVISSNTASGHTYNVAVTGPIPAVDHRISNNTVGDAKYADLGRDGLGSGVCFSGNRRPQGDEPTSDPPAAETLYSCASAATVGLPYPVVTANLMSHARDAGYPN